MDDNLDARTVATPPPPVYGAPPPKRGIPVWVWIAGGVVACGAVCLCAVVGISLSGSDLTKTLGVPGLGTSTPTGGGKIAFVTNFDQKAGRGTLSVMNVDGSGISHIADQASWPYWSPDGARMAYLANVDDEGYGTLTVINADGSNKVTLYDGAAFAAWSPDNQSIAFNSRKDADDNYPLYVASADGQSQRKLSENAAFPYFSPDGSTVAASPYNKGDVRFPLTLFDTGSGARIRQLTDEGTATGWSASSDTILYTALDSTSFQFSLNVIHSDGSGVLRLADDVGGTALSPDGKRVAFTEYHGKDNSYLVVMNVDGTGRRELIEGGFFPSWSPDGTEIVFVQADKTTGIDNVYIMHADGTGVRLLTAKASHPAWQP